MTDNIKTHKKPVLHPLSGRYILGKTTFGGGSQIRPSSLLRVNRNLNNVCIGLALKSFDRCIGKTNDKISLHGFLSLGLTGDKVFNFYVGRRVLRYLRF